MSSVRGGGSGAGAGVDLKSKDEVIEYLKNLGIEYRFGCYKEKTPSGTYVLFLYM